MNLNVTVKFNIWAQKLYFLELFVKGTEQFVQQNAKESLMPLNICRIFGSRKMLVFHGMTKTITALHMSD